MSGWQQWGSGRGGWNSQEGRLQRRADARVSQIDYSMMTESELLSHSEAIQSALVIVQEKRDKEMAEDAARAAEEERKMEAERMEKQRLADLIAKFESSEHRIKRN